MRLRVRHPPPSVSVTVILMARMISEAFAVDMIEGCQPKRNRPDDKHLSTQRVSPCCTLVALLMRAHTSQHIIADRTSSTLTMSSTRPSMSQGDVNAQDVTTRLLYLMRCRGGSLLRTRDIYPCLG